jgi:SAM-dependent methyltransferase
MLKQQQIQENEYSMPYHWFMKRGTYEGRTYFGYMDICSSFLGKDIENLKILDAGCGDGRFLGELAKKGVKNLYGFDYSSKAVSFAKIFLPEADIKVADIKDLPYENNFFERIFLVEVLEHINPVDTNVVLGNLKRVLKNNGELIITVPSEITPTPPKHFQHFSETKIRETLRDYFEIIEIVGQGRVDFSILNFLYKFVDNRFWIVRPFSRYYDEKIWPKYFNKCSPELGERLIIRCCKIAD